MMSALQTSASPCGIQFASFCQFVSVFKQTSERHAYTISFRYFKINRNVHEADRKVQRKHLQNWSTDSAWFLWLHFCLNAGCTIATIQSIMGY